MLIEASDNIRNINQRRICSLFCIVLVLEEDTNSITIYEGENRNFREGRNTTPYFVFIKENGTPLDRLIIAVCKICISKKKHRILYFREAPTYPG